MLDISILNADKATTTPQKLQDFLSKTYYITEKFDGTKLTLWRNGEPWNADYTKNWVVAFKNQILYKEEFEDISRQDIMEFSVGISQYGLIHDHLEDNHINTKDFPLNTEVFIEFIQNKLTTTRDYHMKHGLYLIGYAKSSAEIVGGMIKTNPASFETINRFEYATVLDIATPPILFKGKLDSIESIDKGMLGHYPMEVWELYKSQYEANPYETIKKVFLSIESSLGGKSEGVVLEANDAIYKFVQEDQYDKELRYAKKLRYQATPEIETKYWYSINHFAKDFTKSMDFQKPLETLLKLLNYKVYKMSNNSIAYAFESKLENRKDLTEEDILMKIKDDLFLTAKQLILDRLPENQNALFIGKFRIPTKAHIQIIEDALKEYSHVVVCIVKAKKDAKESLPLEVQSDILTSIFGDSITIITHSTGNLTSIVNKSPKRLRYILAGSDRVDSYEGQLKRHPSLSVVETKRKENFDEEVSATRAITSIKSGDLEEFEKMVSVKVLKFLPIIKEEFKI